VPDSLLTLNIVAPLAFAVLVAMLSGSEKGQLRIATLIGALVSFGLALALYLGYDPAGPEFQFESNVSWIASVGANYHVGVDGLSASLILLTGFLSPIVVLSTFKSIDDRVKEFCISILVLQAAMIGTFAAMDLALFFVFWEAMLVPMYLLIGVWGSQNRVYAAVKFFIYTFAGSALMFVGILYLWYHSGGGGTAGATRTFDLVKVYNDLAAHPLELEPQKLLFLAFALAFAVKVPLFPLHTWLPDAHVEAPAAGSVILAGVLLKMGVYGFMRFAVPLFPDAALAYRPQVITLAVVGIVYGALMSLAQRDIKKLIAYSSVSHLGFCVLGLFALSTAASTGAVYQMLNHGVSTGALFLLVGILYERTHTREISDYGGIAKVVPGFAAMFFIVTLSSIGLPGTNGFVGEFLILSGTFLAPSSIQHANQAVGQVKMPIAAGVAGLAVVLGAVYMLTLYQKVMLGPVKRPERRKLTDLTPREWATVLPLVAMVFVMGVAPQPFLDRFRPAVEQFVNRATQKPPPLVMSADGANKGEAPKAVPSTPPPSVKRLFPQDLVKKAQPTPPGKPTKPK
jgi:NADH-quinone oxidoreductase subunit M